MSDLAMERDLLRDALIGMVRQYCPQDLRDPCQYTHHHMPCEEGAFYALVECGAADWVDNNDYAIRMVTDV